MNETTREFNGIQLNNKDLYRQLAKIALPIAIQGVISATLGLIDNLMVGFIGEVELAAVGIAMQIFFIHYLLLFGFIGGTATYMAQFYGAGDKERIRKVLGFAISVSMAFGLIFFIIGTFFTDQFLSIYVDDPAVKALASQYVKIGSFTFFSLAFSAPTEMALKATQQTKVPMVISSIAFTTNTLLNYVLIFGKFGAPMMGVAGAATATVIARFLEMTLAFIFCFTKKNYFRGGFLSYFGWDKKLVKKIVKNALPTTCNELLWSLGQTMYVAAFSRIGTTPYAGYQAAASIYNIFSFAAFSIGDAALIMVGQRLGEGKSEEAVIVARKLIKVGFIVGAITGGLIIASAWPMTSLFNLSEYGNFCARRILIVYGITIWMGIYNGIHVTGILRGGGDTTFAMVAESCCVWLVAVPLGFFTSIHLGWPIYFALLAVRSEEIFKGILMTIRFRSKKWANTLVDEFEGEIPTNS